MRILQVIPNLKSGGAESFTTELSLELIRKGHICDVATLFDISEETYKTNILSEKTRLLSLHKKHGLDLACFIRLYKLIKDEEYDVVHAHVNSIPYLLLSCILLRKIRFVATIHSDAKLEAGTKLMRWIRKLMFKSGMCVPVTISEESLESFKMFYQMDSSLIYNGLSVYSGQGIASLRDNDEQLLFIHPASCQEIKNQQLLFQAFARLTHVYPNIKLIWAGNNTSYRSLFEKLQKYMVPQIKYIGVVPNVRDYLVQADAMCLSSKMEGMPMTIIEAFSVGCPALCTPVGGILNMIDSGKNGMLSKDLTIESYFEMLKSFIELSYEKRRVMKELAIHSFEKYDISTCADKYLLVYKKILK